MRRQAGRRALPGLFLVDVRCKGFTVMKNRGARGMAVLAALLTGCTVITVEGDQNRIRDAGGHGGVALPEETGDAPTWVERVERIEKALGIAHKGSQQ